jgi:hypothetical protein
MDFADNGGIAIVDRCLVGDYAFALMQHRKGFISDVEWKVYRSVAEKDRLPKPDVILYLSCTPEVGFERMRRRNISSEVSGYTLEYFQELLEAYTETLDLLGAKESKTGEVTLFEWGKNRSPRAGLLDDESCCLLLDTLLKALLKPLQGMILSE